MLNRLLHLRPHRGGMPVPQRPDLERRRSKQFALEARVDALELACSALWELLKEEHGYTDGQLSAKIEEVDRMDGAADGRVTPQKQTCPFCGRNLLVRVPLRCVWCGMDLPKKPF